MATKKMIGQIMEWINCENELPPCDGRYFVTNRTDSEWGWGCCDYDGYGFSSYGIYVTPTHWAYDSEKIKKYGKQKDPQ